MQRDPQQTTAFKDLGVSYTERYNQQEKADNWIPRAVIECVWNASYALKIIIDF